MTLYELYFNDFPFFKKSDYQLYVDIFKNKINIMLLNYDPLEYPLLEKEKEDFIKRKEEAQKQINERSIIGIYYRTPNVDEIKDNGKEDAFISTIIKRRELWLENLSSELYENHGNKIIIYDKLLYDLIYKLINYKSEENIVNFNDYFNHPFFAQYNY